MNAKVVTFGCRLNAYESQVMQEHADKAGLEEAIIFNTCAVTKEAERSARQAIRKARRENPNAKIIVTGCAAQIDPDGYGGMKEVDQVIGNDLKLKEETWTGKPTEKLLVNDIMSVTETASHLVNGFDGKARAFLQVQNGCDHRCTFCIIPYGRGNSRSVPIGEIAQAVKHLVEQGYQEVVLTGVDVTSYGPDLPGKPTLGQMIRRVLALVPDLPRIRLSSLDPVEIDADLWWLIEHEPRLMPHLHLSLQAGDDMILKRMKRRHNRQDVIDVCKRARSLRPDMSFGADIIAGFPTETDEMFENSMKIVEECDLTFLHVFPYSEREGTPAAKIPANKQVPVPIRKERAAKLRGLGEAQLAVFNERQIGKQVQIIVEKDNVGHSECFAEVHFDDPLPIGSLAIVYITSLVDGRLFGKIVSQ
ncbi:MAG: tRNA (N(6)-L-threonylcarbamoyladenosine(37)-C(2))-methylthiotransferase MtaB [Micavibrio sp.]|nr:tRNA (N(6)-L-threonylcarbamoyladenosine(37)-C(2))-methylthiotransferase MtaB [Micavibrio sp.]